MSLPELQSAIATVAPGRWGVGVSGGADSVALFSLLKTRSDLQLHVIHLDHQTRAGQSTADASFVQSLAAQNRVPSTIALRSDVESNMSRIAPNPSARYRAARLKLFRSEVAAHDLRGVILAHHADDQAETVLQRLLRGSGMAGLAGMSPVTEIGGLLIVRPLLGIRRAMLRDYLYQAGQDWREDASNASDKYLRNRLRRWLGQEPALHNGLIALAEACRQVKQWAMATAPQLEDTFATSQLGELPALLAEESARRWLICQGSPPGQLSQKVLDRLIEMTQDAATPSRVNFPGSIAVCRRGGMISSIKGTL